MIDLSHANQKTFDGMIRTIETIKQNGQEVTFFSSHSNVRTLCDRTRNLTDHQMLQIHHLRGKVGIFSN